MEKKCPRSNDRMALKYLITHGCFGLEVTNDSHINTYIWCHLQCWDWKLSLLIGMEKNTMFIGNIKMRCLSIWLSRGKSLLLQLTLCQHQNDFTLWPMIYFVFCYRSVKVAAMHWKVWDVSSTSQRLIPSVPYRRGMYCLWFYQDDLPLWCAHSLIPWYFRNINYFVFLYCLGYVTGLLKFGHISNILAMSKFRLSGFIWCSHEKLHHKTICCFDIFEKRKF